MQAPTLSPQDRIDVEFRLKDARAKLHLLLIGRLSVEVAADGYIVKYTRASLPQLRAYIADMENLLAGKRKNGAVTIIF